MKATQNNIDKVDEMADQVIELARCYAVYWELEKKPNYDRYSRLYDKHENFFGTLLNGLLHGFFVTSYQLFDPRKKKDVTSLITLINELKQTNLPLAKTLGSKIAAEDSLLKKVISLRCKVFAHRNKRQSPSEVFDSAKITPKEMERVVRLAQDIIVSLAFAVDLDDKDELEEIIRLRWDQSADDTSRIMQTLEKGFR